MQDNPQAMDVIYEPRKYYEERLEKQYHENAEAYFEELVAKANVDAALNAKHAEQYWNAVAALKDAQASQSGKKGLGIFVVVLSIICILVGLILLPIGFGDPGQLGWAIGVGFALVVLGIGLIVLRCTAIKKAIADANNALAQAQLALAQAEAACRADMASLNELYDWNIPLQIMEKTTPIIDLDPIFSVGRLSYLVKKFGLPEDLGPNTSVLGVLSGHIQGNPFLLERVLNEDFRAKTYYGELEIHWTTTYTDKNGTHTQHHSQTLRASVEHDAPYYSTDTRLLYGNEAAPNLHFSRCPMGADSKNDKQLMKFVRTRKKTLDKNAHDDLMANDPTTNFTPMANDKFDAVFGADDRDNEMEFRLLYTPLAQRNIIDILTNNHPYGDDFYMVKDGMISSVASRHSQSFDYSANPAMFVDFILTRAKENFVKYCDDFIRALYFDLAPIISVPLYQMHSPEEFIFETNYPTNFTSYEQETMANSIDADYFRPADADPSLPLLIKALPRSSSRNGSDGDTVELHVYSYQTTPMVDYVSMKGGDGRMHDVPVHWIKYDYVECNKTMGMASVGSTNKSYRESQNQGLLNFLNAFHYERGLFSFVLDQAPASVQSRIKGLFK